MQLVEIDPVDLQPTLRALTRRPEVLRALGDVGTAGVGRIDQLNAQLDRPAQQRPDQSAGSNTNTGISLSVLVWYSA